MLSVGPSKFVGPPAISFLQIHHQPSEKQGLILPLSPNWPREVAPSKQDTQATRVCEFNTGSSPGIIYSCAVQFGHH